MANRQTKVQKAQTNFSHLLVTFSVTQYYPLKTQTNLLISQYGLLKTQNMKKVLGI